MEFDQHLRTAQFARADARADAQDGAFSAFSPVGFGGGSDPLGARECAPSSRSKFLPEERI